MYNTMKTLKLAIAAVILACTFQAANAQVRVGVRVGTPPPRREVVVVRHPVHREVIVQHAPARRVYRRSYHKPVYVHHYRHQRMVRHY
ncbi:hypothetical protein [Mucilaginibacter sp. UR6-11]|uniref:hypothetical protein n=1 Tax=Mucilaginibacter sp. UR6-11 TaxID=1435644 RepID=UPI001E5B3E54|nr:hypothetical protein [Mucilaginibacter sp. UR6-11]MCC8425606.1 hypothetical protein [Mucilaginibacter sp. UR6-11]